MDWEKQFNQVFGWFEDCCRAYGNPWGPVTLVGAGGHDSPKVKADITLLPNVLFFFFLLGSHIEALTVYNLLLLRHISRLTFLFSQHFYCNGYALNSKKQAYLIRDFLP